MHSTEFELLETLQKPVCAVCDLSGGAAQGYLKGVLSDGVNDPACATTGGGAAGSVSGTGGSGAVSSPPPCRPRC